MNAMADKFFDSIKGKKVTFIGIGTSNLPLIKLFVEKGAKVTACDKKNFEDLGQNGIKAKEYGAELLLGENYLSEIDADIVFRSPGTPFYKDELVALRNKGVVLTSEMEVFFDLCPCRIIAVTGSDGKTTTTTIISEFLKAAGFNVHLGGNIGKPLLPEIESVNDDDYAVVELSSFQLISMRKSPDIAVVTNLAPNHLDIHKDMQEYIDSKKNIILHQNAFSKAVLNLDNEITNGFSDSVRGQLAKFSVKENVSNGAFLDGDTICYNDYGKITRIMNIHDIKIPGMHNVENYLAAFIATKDDVEIETMKKVAETFAGVEHRCELVREIDGVKYYNDSIASSPTRTLAGLFAFEKKVILIAGGYDKHIPFEPLAEQGYPFIKEIILMGDTRYLIKEAFDKLKDEKGIEVPSIMVNSLEEAVIKAKEIAKEGDIITLSPACASFDMFPNFAVRGNKFKEIVNNI